jgi:hypothetical protein
MSPPKLVWENTRALLFGIHNIDLGSIMRGARNEGLLVVIWPLNRLGRSLEKACARDSFRAAIAAQFAQRRGPAVVPLIQRHPGEEGAIN